VEATGSNTFTVADVQPALCLHASLRKAANGSLTEVDTSASFRLGDNLAVRVEVCSPGYLYIINRNSSGSWTPIFPSANTPAGGNRVEVGRAYNIPEEGSLTVTSPAGEERMFMILSRQPVSDLSALENEMAGQPAGHDENTSPRVGTMLAENRPMDDAFVERLKPRDLVIDPPVKPSSQQDGQSGLYAATTNATASAHAVLDLRIKHD
jgi:hypothetical protein